jgi:hypothetical protein
MARPSCATLGLTTVKLAIKDWRRKRMLSEIEEEKGLLPSGK